MLPATRGAAAFEWLPFRALWVATSTPGPRTAGWEKGQELGDTDGGRAGGGRGQTHRSLVAERSWLGKAAGGENKVAPWSLNRKQQLSSPPRVGTAAGGKW